MLYAAADDKSNILQLFTEKPKRYAGYWVSDFGQSIYLDRDDVPYLKDISWKDEPVELEITPKGMFDAIYSDLRKAESLIR